MSKRLTPAQQLAADIGSFTHDPLGYVLYNFPWGVPGTPLANKRLRKWQRRQLEKIGVRLRAGAATVGDVIRMAVGSGHGIGKSALVSMLVKWAFDTFPDMRGVVTANTDIQLRTKTWAELSKWHNMSLTKDWATLTATALISNMPGHDKTWRIDAVPWSESNTDAFAGLHNEGKRVLLIFDEAAGIIDKVWEVALGALTDANTEIIWSVYGNPTRNTGYFRECFREYASMWDTENIDNRTVEGTNLAELQKIVDAYGEDSDTVRVRIRGLFPSAGAKQFYPSKITEDALKRHLPAGSWEFAPVVIALDPAWEGDDDLVFIKRQGLRAEVLARMPKNSNDNEVGALLARFEDEHQADGVFIDFGYGTGVRSYGVTIGRTHWMLVNFAGAASKPGFLNKRAEIYDDLRRWLAEGGSLFYLDHDAQKQVRRELDAVEAKPNLSGKVQIEAKAEYKKRTGFSPNIVDALAISFAYTVTRKPRDEDGRILSATRASPPAPKPGQPYNPLG